MNSAQVYEIFQSQKGNTCLWAMLVCNFMQIFCINNILHPFRFGASAFVLFAWFTNSFHCVDDDCGTLAIFPVNKFNLMIFMGTQTNCKHFCISAFIFDLEPIIHLSSIYDFCWCDSDTHFACKHQFQRITLKFLHSLDRCRMYIL